MFRHYYDSRMFPFLSDLLFDQLFNFDWESSRKEIEEEKKLKKECGKKNCNYLRVLDDWASHEAKVYGPEFKLEDGVYTFEANIGKNVKPADVKIDAYDGRFFLSYSSKTETGENSSALTETLPDDLDIESMKAVLKNGKLTITAGQVIKEAEPEKDDDEDVEFEIEIGK